MPIHVIGGLNGQNPIYILYMPKGNGVIHGGKVLLNKVLVALLHVYWIAQ